ncbi:MAG: acyltransferase family protein [Ruminococcus sp.]|nr:acyltransferase family protein [Ruminococcus sp.]
MSLLRDKLNEWAYGGCKTDGRAHLYDNVKFFLIIMVVMGHFIDDLTEFKPHEQSESLNDLLKGIFIFIYSFHMPAFLFISGLFVKKVDEVMNWKPVKVYVMLGLLLKLVVGIGQMLWVDEQSNGYFSLLGGDGVFWYLFVLAFYRVITHLLRHCDRRFLMVFAILMAFMAGYDNETDEWLSLSRAIVFFPFYYAGVCLKPEQVQSFCKRWYIRIMSVAVTALWVYFCFWRFDDVRHFRRLFTGKNPYSVVQLPNTEFWDRAAAMLISSAMIIAVISLVPSVVIPFFTKFGLRTLQVYFWHRPLLYYIVCTDIFDDLFFIKLPNHWWWAALLMSVAVTYLLSAEIVGRPIKLCMRLIDDPNNRSASN